MSSFAFRLVLLTITALMFPVTVAAHTVFCLPWSVLLSDWGEKYKEAPAAGGAVLGGVGSIVLFPTRDGRVWTVVRRTRRGLACIVASGEGWTDFDWYLRDDGKDASREEEKEQ